MRWGQFLSYNPSTLTPVTPIWGDGTFWGQADTTNRTLTWIIEIDWDGDGLFDGSNEMPYVSDISIRRGRKNFINSTGTGFERIAIGEATIQLENNSGRFDAYNSSGPLYGNIFPGRLIRIRVLRESDGVIKNIFFGRILDIRPSFGDNQTVTITAQDDIALLKSQTVKTSVYSTIRYNTAIANILSAINWKTGTSIDATVSDTMPYWWASGKSAFDELSDLVDAVEGLFFISTSGVATYLDRLDNANPIATISDADWYRGYGVRVPQPWEVVKNLIRVYSRARTSYPAIALWQMSDQPSIASGASITVWATFSYNSQNVAATTVTTPVVTTDYTGSINSADISIVMTVYGSSAQLVITNNNASAQILTLMKLRGTAITADQYTYTEASDANSIDKNGQREFDVQTDWLQDVNSAISQASSLLTKLSNPKQYPRIALRNNPTEQFESDLFDLHTLSLTSRNITGILRIGYIEYRSLSTNLQQFETILYYEPNSAGQVTGTWVFPAIFGSTTVFS